MRSAFSDAIVAAAVSNPKVLLLTGDHGYALFDVFRSERPRQFINCGVAEQNMIGVAAGLAKAGFRPIVYGLSAFVPMRVMEQIKIDICYEGLPVTIVGDGAGLVYSHLGTSHQCTEDIACTRVLPGLTVLSPADRREMRAAMQLALFSIGPTYVRMGKSDRGEIHASDVQLAPGGLLPVRSGRSGIVFLATGSMVATALEVASGYFDAAVWSVPSIKPLDVKQLRDACAEARAIVTLEEHSIIGGLGACVAEMLTETGCPPLLRVGVDDKFSEHCGTWDYLMREHNLDPKSVTDRVQAFLARGAKDGRRLSGSR